MCRLLLEDKRYTAINNTTSESMVPGYEEEKEKKVLSGITALHASAAYGRHHCQGAAASFCQALIADERFDINAKTSAGHTALLDMAHTIKFLSSDTEFKHLADEFGFIEVLAGSSRFEYDDGKAAFKLLEESVDKYGTACACRHFVPTLFQKLFLSVQTFPEGSNEADAKSTQAPSMQAPISWTEKEVRAVERDKHTNKKITHAEHEKQKLRTAHKEQLHEGGSVQHTERHA